MKKKDSEHGMFIGIDNEESETHTHALDSTTRTPWMIARNLFIERELSHQTGSAYVQFVIVVIKVEKLQKSSTYSKGLTIKSSSSKLNTSSSSLPGQPILEYDVLVP